MALSRRSGQRFSTAIWPGFVDAMTALLLVLIFVLSIFMIVQSVLRETITTQDTELEGLAAQVANLTDALGLSRARVSALEGEVEGLTGDLDGPARDRPDAGGADRDARPDAGRARGELQAPRAPTSPPSRRGSPV
jgi:chemotaxis protein MotB